MRILIVEDEAPAARRLERLSAKHFGDTLEYVTCAESVLQARAALAGARFDLVLLDLDLDGADGFEVLKGVSASPSVIIVSARVDRAIDAFDTAVVDFVPKPVSPDRLARALARAVEAPSRQRDLNLVVRSSGRMHLVPLAQVAALCGADDYVEVVLFDGRRFLHDVRLEQLERKLSGDFLRVHRSHILNLRHLLSVEKSTRGSLTALLAGRSRVPVSRRQAAKLTAALRRNSIASAGAD